MKSASMRIHQSPLTQTSLSPLRGLVVLMHRTPGVSLRSTPGYMLPRLRRSTRSGITILEVLLSVAIFLGAMTAIGSLLTTGADSAIQAKLHTEAVIRCESKLAEAVSGVIELDAVSDKAFPDDTEPGWSWSLAVDSGPHADLLALEVTVTHETTAGFVDAQYTLNRLVRDPNVYLDAEMATTGDE